MSVDFTGYLERNGEWLRGDGPASGIVISCRVRLARNLAGERFPGHADHNARLRVAETVRATLADAPTGLRLMWCPLDKLPPVDRHFLVERHLISRELANDEGPRALAFDPEETMAAMVNEEDHLRLQSIRSGFSLMETFQAVNRLDDELAERLDYAFDERYGYLTACPSNVGTGLRASVMVHLPALVMTKHMKMAFQAVHDLRLTVRGLYGEGTEAYGELYQISNQIACGRAEEEIVEDLQSMVEGLLRYEDEAREQLRGHERGKLEDRIWRSYAALKHARLMSSEEAMKHLSSLRLGIAMGLVPRPELPALNRLFLFSQPAHLQRMAGRELAQEERDEARARYSPALDSRLQGEFLWLDFFGEDLRQIVNR